MSLWYACVMRSEFDLYLWEPDLMKSGFGGEHSESNHRLMYT
jgi:hypothetical protein